MSTEALLAQIIKDFHTRLPDMQEKLGQEDWPAFQKQLGSLLVQLDEAATLEEQEALIKQILQLNEQFPGLSIIFRSLRKKSGLFGLEDASNAPTPKGSGELREAMAPLLDTVSQTGEEKAAEEEDERYLNAGFYTIDGIPIPPEKALVVSEAPYGLWVNIGDFWGVGEPDIPMPEQVLDPLYEEDAVELKIAVHASTLTVPPTFQTLRLGRTGDSETLRFGVEMSSAGTHYLSIDVLFNGHLIQSRRIKIETVLMPDMPNPAEPQTAHTTFTRTKALSPKELAQLANEPRTLTIVQEALPDSKQIGLRFYDNSGETIGVQATTLDEGNLVSAIKSVRVALFDLMKKYAEARNQLPEATLVKSLSRIAMRGYALYSQLLPDVSNSENPTLEGYKIGKALQPETVIQIAPLSGRLSIPWEALYDQPVHNYNAETTRLCDSYQTHGPRLEDCPYAGNGHVICPHRFWGFRYIIEQLPGRLVVGEQPAQRSLPQLIKNGQPTSLSGIVYPGFKGLRTHWPRLEQLAPANDFKLQQLYQFNEIESFMQNNESKTDIVYFYAHGGEEVGIPALKVADGRKVTIGDLAAWRVNWHAHPPLLILNACKSAQYDPDSFEDMIQEWFKRGAAGVIGTQCTIYEDLVDLMMPRFLHRFLRKMTVGRALYESRRSLMWGKRRDPRGLTYSLFAASELKLARAVASIR